MADPLYTYKVPYVDNWGNLRDPRTTWDILLKYYKHWVMLLVGEGTRKMAQPCEFGAHRILQAAERRHKQNLQRAHILEARYLRKRARGRSRKKRRVSQHRVTSATSPR